ncbi:calponin homology domain-containing protein [Absidia repens]|uniref:Calponin homology domain-containing protein n=1 Tax=Absidia repens TaxID=90262 RepID=A0A1X2I0Q0_9FUNG|nr:calponin homology domain-containing protein [Absidia repens]
MTESRTELVIWVNNLLQLQYTKVEQLGTGIAYSQIIDSIYGDVHLAKIKFFAKHEYEYIENYKVLQRAFEKHKINKIIPVERLVKCRFQDNLEFLQWIKMFWDSNYQGQAYDALGRRQRGINKAATILSSASAPSRQMIHGRLSNRGNFSDMASYASSSTASSSTAATPIDTIGGNVYSGYGRNCQSPSSASTLSVDSNSIKAKRSRIYALGSPQSSPLPKPSQSRILVDLNQQLAELEVAAKQLNSEKEFYFTKLLNIENVLDQHGMYDAERTTEPLVKSPVLKKIQTILFDEETI